MSDVKKSGWDKAEIILKPAGGLLTALAVASVGFFGSQFLEKRQSTETNVRLYAELMSSREEADSSLRKEMFNTIIGTFLKTKSSQKAESVEDYEEEVLKLELLAHNFHDALALGPLFKHVHRRINNFQSSAERNYLAKRLQKVGRIVKGKQIAALADVGDSKDGYVDFEELEKKPEGIEVINHTLELYKDKEYDLGSAPKARKFNLEALVYNKEKSEIRVRLRVFTPEDMNDADIDITFWVGPFDFPMIDNTRLSHGQRCAVIVKNFEEDVSAEIALVYFPGSRASLKEKPYYEEVIEDLLQTRELINSGIEK